MSNMVRRDARQDIEKLRDEFTRALPKHIPSEKFVRTVVTAIQLNPDLMAADRTTLLGACMRAAQDGLLPDGREAVLNVYNTKVKRKNDQGREVETWVKAVQYLPMVRGLQKLARNSGEVKGLAAEIVFERDKFTVVLGDERRLIHEPFLGDDRGQPLFAYAVAVLTDGSKEFDWMDKARIERVKAVSKSPNGPMWTTWWDEAWKKTVLKRLTKKLPSSTDKEGADAFMQAAERDEEETFDARDAKDVTSAPAASLDDFGLDDGVVEDLPSAAPEPQPEPEPAKPTQADKPAYPPATADDTDPYDPAENEAGLFGDPGTSQD